MQARAGSLGSFVKDEMALICAARRSGTKTFCSLPTTARWHTAQCSKCDTQLISPTTKISGKAFCLTMKGLFFLAALVAAVTVDAFVPIQTCQTSFRRISSSEVLLSTAESSPPEFADSEREEMKDLILSLSLESTDHKRRMRLKDVLHEALDRPNGMPQRFTDLFDITLAEVGDEIQREAKKKFFEAEAAEQAKAESSDDESSDDINGADEFVVESDDENEKGGELKLKTPEELQLWALVDMMVQSKTIVKKASGELGSKGTFQ